MSQITNNAEASFKSLGEALHAAAVTSKAVIKAIPRRIDVTDECAAIDAAAAPVNDLAEQILAIPASNKAELAVKARAVAWFDGCYWSTQETPREHRLSSPRSI